jgi:hypothetical protein
VARGNVAAQEAVARARLEGVLDEALAGDGPVVVGPWRAEVGYEVLYWLPFLRRILGERKVPRERLVAYSRGGVATWYDDVCGRYVDIFDVVEPNAFRSRTEVEWRRAGGQKQSWPSDLDRWLLDCAADRLGTFSGVLHPSAMFDLFRHIWKGGGTMQHVTAHTRYERWTAPSDPVVEAALPAEFIAVKLYQRDSFPDTSTNRALCRAAVEHLAALGPVVFLHTGLTLDEHAELDPSGLGLRPLAGVEPSANLHAQSVVLARAQAYVGTYGGLSYLAGAYGVPSVSLASDGARLFRVHADVARRAAAATGGSFAVLDTTKAARLPLTTPLLLQESEHGEGLRPSPEVAPHRRPLVRALLARARRRSSAGGTKSEVLARLTRALAPLRDGAEPVVFAGWTGTDEDELLYWIPFVRWAVSRYDGECRRIAVVCLPGRADLYSGLPKASGVEGATTVGPQALRELLAAVRAGTEPVRSLVDRLSYVPQVRTVNVGPVAVELLPSERLPDPAMLEEVATALESEGPVRRLRGLPADLDDAAAFVGPWGAGAVAAVLAGVPTVAVHAGARATATVDADVLERAAHAVHTPFALLDARQLPVAAAVAAAARG